jgi:hypothetical protein
MHKNVKMKSVHATRSPGRRATTPAARAKAAVSPPKTVPKASPKPRASPSKGAKDQGATEGPQDEASGRDARTAARLTRSPAASKVLVEYGSSSPSPVSAASSKLRGTRSSAIQFAMM